MRRSTLTAIAVATSLTLAACTDTNAPRSPRAAPAVLPSAALTPAQLDELAQTLIDVLFPNGLETAAGTRWENVKRKLADGDRSGAISKYNELVDWVLKKQPSMDAPPNGESRNHAVARLIAAMSTYVYGGESPIPLGSLEGDVAVGIVTPGAAATIVTPRKHAGVALEAGSVATTTVVIVAQNTTGNFGEVCSGPLLTALCQYPLYYKFEPYPHARLLKPGRFAVCHVNTGPFSPPEGIHDRFRLAHTKPANPADYTPGAIRPDDENIEILPFVQVNFTDCLNTSYTPPGPVIGSTEGSRLMDRSIAALHSALTAAGSFLSPKNAYAIDLGGGGESFSFSDFNVLDPVRNPIIDFETFPSGASTSPSCDAGCDLSKQFSDRGVLFDFRRDADQQLNGFATLQLGTNNPLQQPTHTVTNARIPGQASGVLNGTIIMTFQSATHVTFVLRYNASVEGVQVNAFTPTGAGIEFARSEGVLYSACEDCTVFREEIITIHTDAGVARVEARGPGAQLLIDDLLISSHSH